MNEQEQTIDLRMLFKVFTGHIIPIAAVTLAVAAIGFVLAFFVIPKQYASETLMYVENSAAGRDDSSININDINAAQKLVNTCQILFTSDYVFEEIDQAFGGVYPKEKLKNMIKISSVNSTEILKITVTTGSPQKSFDLATKYAELAKAEFKRIIKGGSIESVSPPTFPEKLSFPSLVRFTVIGAAAGFVLIYIVFLLKEILDIKVKPEDDLSLIYDIPVFAEILDFDEAEKSGSKYFRYNSGESGGYGDEFYPGGDGAVQDSGGEGRLQQ